MKEQTKNRLWVVGVGGILGVCIGSIIYQIYSIGRIIPAFFDWASFMWNENKEGES